MNCPTCGAGLVPDAKFCGACGTPANTQTAAPQQPDQQQAWSQQPDHHPDRRNNRNSRRNRSRLGRNRPAGAAA